MRLSGSSLGLYSTAAHITPKWRYYDRKNGIMSLKGFYFDNVEVVTNRTLEGIFDHDELISDGIPAGKVGGLHLPATPKGSCLLYHFPASLLKHSIRPTDDASWGKLVKDVLSLDLEIFNEWTNIALESPAPDPYGGRRARLIAFWRTLVEDLDPEDHNRAGNTSRLPSSFDRLVEGWVVDDDQFPPRRHFLDSALEFKDSVGSDLFGRRMFRTKKGWVGISCTHVQPGDIVCLLSGGWLPFLLRGLGS